MLHNAHDQVFALMSELAWLEGLAFGLIIRILEILTCPDRLVDSQGFPVVPISVLISRRIVFAIRRARRRGLLVCSALRRHVEMDLKCAGARVFLIPFGRRSIGHSGFAIFATSESNSRICICVFWSAILTFRQ